MAEEAEENQNPVHAEFNTAQEKAHTNWKAFLASF
jgi:hypothetical protein